MKIVFNSLMSGCGNNGGTRTILLSAHTLRKLGHEVEVVAKVDNFTWFDHKPVINYIPNNADVLINIAAVDYNGIKNHPIKNKFAWWRGHEIWANSEEYLKSIYLDTNVKNLVNSKGMQQLLKRYGAESEVVYQGIDIDKWYNEYLRPEYTIQIGCLYSSKDIKRWKDFEKLAKILGNIEFSYVAMGSERCKSDVFLDKYIQNPLQEELKNFYSSCHIWFSPVTSEGLHNPPMEAALCGAVIVCSDCVTNGMVLDYVSPSTAMIYREGDIEHAAALIRKPVWHSVIIMQNVIRNQIGTREDNMKKLIKILERRP